ncbi:expressed protein [Aureococcus anophagefferens]|uniref:Expressed protein n=1 Tax=Aureococcus anophagefferens TaxID=44056 RepID=F0Y5S6_AURAN|nr:expressed protein [Aureococcus anophagefferens]EGB09745.1 expressed protein [Aureococcus anophagefferens]|eukprot:XP_009035786.1 expressed protein [Aureococcus anophagefferens]
MKTVARLVLLLVVGVAGALDLEALVESLLDKLNGTSVGPVIATCLGDLGAFESQLNASVAAIEAGSATQALDGLYLSTRALARAVDDCDVPLAVDYLEKGANALGFNATAHYAGEALTTLVFGLNVTEDVLRILDDAANGAGSDAGAALGDLILALEGSFSCDGKTGTALEACVLFEGLLGGAKIFLQDQAACEGVLEDAVGDVARAVSRLSEGDGAGVFNATVAALADLGRAADACGLPDVAALLQQETGELRAANVTVTDAPGVLLNVTVEGLDVSGDVAAIAAAAAADDSKAAGLACAKLALSLRSAGCDSKACGLFEALLDAFAIVGSDASGDCAADLGDAETLFVQGAAALTAGDVEAGLFDFSVALRDVGGAARACQLDALADLIAAEAVKLGAANVTAAPVHILVDGLDVADAVYDAAKALVAEDWAAAGAALGDLVAALDAFHCGDDKACLVVENLIAALAVVSADVGGACAADLETTWSDLSGALASFEGGDAAAGVANLSVSLTSLATALGNDCGLERVAALVESEAAALGAANVTAAGSAVAVLVKGVDVASEIAVVAAAASKGDAATAGKELGALLETLGVAACDTAVCEIVNAIVSVFEDVTQDVSGCSGDFGDAAADLATFAADLGGGDVEAALAPLSRSLKDMGAGLKDCGVPEVADALGQCADQLGLASVGADAALVASVLVAGEDVLDEFGDAGLALSNGSYATAGASLARGLKDILAWNATNGCASAACLLLEGAMAALGALEGDFAACEADLDAAWTALDAGFESLATHAAFSDASNGVLKNDTVLWNQPAQVAGAPSDLLSRKNCEVFKDQAACDIAAKNLRHQRLYAELYRRRHGNATAELSSWWPSWDDITEDFDQLVAHVEEDVDRVWSDLVDDLEYLVGDDVAMAAIKDVAAALSALSSAITDCHAEEIAQVLSKLAAILGAPAGIGWLDEGFKIVVDAAEVSNDVYDALLFVKQDDYFMAGYEIAKLAVVLVA